MQKPLTYSPNKIIFTLLAAQSLFSAASILSFTVASIQVVDLAGGDKAWTGVPSTVGLIGAALISYPIGRLMDSVGRRIGMSIGFVFGIIGLALAGWAFLQHSLILFLIGMFLFGLNRGALELGRYAAADVSPSATRGRAISLVVTGGTVGSLAGPTLIKQGQIWATQLSLPPDAGSWLLASILAALGLILITVLLHPDPRLIRLHRAATGIHPAATLTPPRKLAAVMQDPRAKLAVGAMVFSQLAMVIVMTITPFHMREHHHEIPIITWVLTGHTMGMFAFSIVAGWLADRFGRAPIIFAGGLMSIAACVMAPLSNETWWLSLALFLLGLGWSFCFVAGSALLDDILLPQEKGAIQGAVDGMVKISSGAGSLGSGVMFSLTTYAFTSWITLIAAVIPVILVIVLSVPRHSTQVVEEGVG